MQGFSGSGEGEKYCNVEFGAEAEVTKWDLLNIAAVWEDGKEL